jgi:ATP synthase protein I
VSVILIKMNPLYAAFSLLGIGFYVAACIILGILGGRWLDGKMNTAPLWLLVGLVLGLLAAVYGTYQMLKPFLKDLGDGRKDKGSK